MDRVENIKKQELCVETDQTTIDIQNCGIIHLEPQGVFHMFTCKVYSGLLDFVIA